MKRCVYLLVVILVICTYTKIRAQCGTETFTVGNWCENQYATWTITNPDPGASYHWYEPVYNTAGTAIIDTLDRYYGQNANGTYFVSPYRYTTPTPVPTGSGWDARKFWYVKEKPVSGFVPIGTITADGGQPTQTTGYGMTFTSLTTIRFNSVAVPVVLYNAVNTFKIQIQIGTYYSAVFSFTGADCISLGSQTYLVTIPVNLTIPAGSYTMSVVTNPAGTQNVVDGLRWSAQNTFTQQTFSVPNIISAANTLVANIWSANHTSPIYNWNFTSYCNYTYSPVATKTTVGCCTPVIISEFISPSKPIIVSGTETSILTLTSYKSAANYFEWFKDGVAITGKAGIGMTSISTTQAGVYSAREVASSADVNNVSCYSEGTSLIQERALFAKLDNSKTSYCIGDKVTVEAYGTNISNVSWDPASLATNPNSKTTSVTLNAAGNINFTATSNVFVGNNVINGNFESGNTGFTSNMTNTTGTPSNGQYRIDTIVTPQQSFWSAVNPGSAAAQWKGSGNFLYADGFNSANGNNTIWKQTVNVSQNSNYTFSMDNANISWNSDPSNSARVADVDASFDIFINNVKIATFVTDGQAQYSGVGRWKTDTISWNSGTNTQATIDIRQSVLGTQGYDFAIDNIMFGGPIAQTAMVTVGPVVDCFEVKASKGTCVGDSVQLSASAINSVTGAIVGVIDHWEANGVNVGTGSPIYVSPTTNTVYKAFAYFPSTNLIQNGDFELGVNGFNYGAPNGLYDLMSTTEPGGFAITTNPNTNNSYSAVMGDHTSGTGKMLVVDSKSTDANVISYSFNATVGNSYLFSLWAANACNFTQNPNPICSSLSFIINGPGVTNLVVATLNLNLDNIWRELSAVWTPPSSGVFTLTLFAKGDNTLQPLCANTYNCNGGNDFAIDDIQLATTLKTVYTDTVSAKPCISCTKPNQTLSISDNPSSNAICPSGTAILTSNTLTPATRLQVYTPC